MTDPITLKLQELVPEIETTTDEDRAFGDRIFREPTLSDVLRAIGGERNVNAGYLKGDYLFLRQEYGVEKSPTDWYGWNLLEDWDNQLPELKAFVGTLIGVTN